MLHQNTFLRENVFSVLSEMGKAEFLCYWRLRISAKDILRFSASVACETIFPLFLSQCTIVFLNKSLNASLTAAVSSQIYYHADADRRI